jgi:hypothetical protein
MVDWSDQHIMSEQFQWIQTLFMFINLRIPLVASSRPDIRWHIFEPRPRLPSAAYPFRASSNGRTRQGIDEVQNECVVCRVQHLSLFWLYQRKFCWYQLGIHGKCNPDADGEARGTVFDAVALQLFLRNSIIAQRSSSLNSGPMTPLPEPLRNSWPAFELPG